MEKNWGDTPSATLTHFEKNQYKNILVKQNCSSENKLYTFCIRSFIMMLSKITLLQSACDWPHYSNTFVCAEFIGQQQ